MFSSGAFDCSYSSADCKINHTREAQPNQGSVRKVTDLTSDCRRSPNLSVERIVAIFPARCFLTGCSNSGNV